jgi:D-glycero-D-manno-heptose 1,7-bisphosphate phosphatase
MHPFTQRVIFYHTKSPLREEGAMGSRPAEGEIPPNGPQHLRLFGIIAPMQPAIFLDRDGVIVENNPNYIRSWEDIKFIPRSISALAQMNESHYQIVLVTNQSAVGRGIISAELAIQINFRLVDEIQRAGGRIDGIYMCPHSPDDKCRCRKPEPGLLLRAAGELAIDLEQSIMIGDALSDLQAGQAAGLRRLILVRSGRGRDQELLPQPDGLMPYQVFADLAGALQSIIDTPEI